MSEGFKEYRKAETTWAVKLPRAVTIETPEGTMEAAAGDFLALDSQGRPYPIAREEFEAIYEPVEDEDKDKDKDKGNQDDTESEPDPERAAGPFANVDPGVATNGQSTGTESTSNDDVQEDDSDDDTDERYCDVCGDGPFGERGLAIHNGRADDHPDDPQPVAEPTGDDDEGASEADDSADDQVAGTAPDPAVDEADLVDCPDCHRRFGTRSDALYHRADKHIDVGDDILPATLTEGDVAAVAEVEHDLEGVSQNLEVDVDRALGLLARFGVIDKLTGATEGAT